jgi:hypothetical protein
VERKLCLLLVAIFLGAISAQAQGIGDKIEVSLGYSFMRFHSQPTANLNGWDFSGHYRLSEWLGVDADATGEYGKVNGVSSRVYTYVFGPQVTWPFRKPKGLTPFAHLLVGGSHFDGGGFASRAWAWEFGAGVDKAIKPRLSWRILEVDTLPTYLGNADQHNTRILTGIIFRF